MKRLLFLFWFTAALAGAQFGGVWPDPKSPGSPNAPVTIEIFSDFQCQHCAKLHMETLKAAMADCVAKGQVRLIHRDYPLEQHKFARLAARYANAAAQIGRYEKVCDQLFSLQEEWGIKGNVDQVVSRVLTPAEMVQIRKLISVPGAEKTIDRDLALGNMIPLEVTPTMVVKAKNKTYPISGAVTYPILKRFIDSLIAN